MHPSEHSERIQYSGSVVVVDDNDSLRQMLTLAFETAGFDVVEARSEIDLQRYLAHHRPDVLVINMQRSEADGLVLLMRMRARPSLNEVPILFLAGSDAEDFRLQAINTGADLFELRPVGVLGLTDLVAHLIATGREPRHPQPLTIFRLKLVG